MNILISPDEYAQRCIETYGSAGAALEALTPDAVEDVWPRVPAIFWDDVRALLRLETTSDEAPE